MSRNRFIVFTKRILSKKLYLALMAALIFMTAAFELLPASEQSTEIKVALYSNSKDGHWNKLLDALENKNSIYTFYVAESEAALTRDVNSGKAECGFLFPDNFFNDYIYGNAADNPIQEYVTGNTTLGFAISETVFSCIFEICGPDVMLYGSNLSGYEEQLLESYSNYRYGDKIFRLTDNSTGDYIHSTEYHKVSLPVFEFSILLVLFSSLLGLLTFLSDRERGVFVCMGRGEQLSICSISCITAIAPVLIVGLLCTAIVYLSATKLLMLTLFAAVFFAVAMLLSLIIKRSKVLTLLLPVILLIAIIVVFIQTLLP